MVKDGKTIRLRASCNSCNEHKVRCSQHKPNCARCERNGTKCIYGLSRRTHKDAPPLSTHPIQRLSRASTFTNANSSTDGKSDTRWHRFSVSQTSTGITSNSSSSPDPSIGTQDAAYPPDNSASAWSLLMARSPQPHGMVASISRASISSNTTACLLELVLEFASIPEPLNALEPPLSATVAQYAQSTSIGSHCGGIRTISIETTSEASISNPQQTPPTDQVTLSSFSDCGQCNCHSSIGEPLIWIRDGYNDNRRRLSLDAWLAKLIHCISVGKISMECTHVGEHTIPTHIMAVATLVGHLLDEFGTLARELPGEKEALENTDPHHLSTESENSVSDHVFSREPQLSWGVLKLEEGDQLDLRLQICMLAFRKLERLVQQLTLFQENLREKAADSWRSSQYEAFVLACDCICLLLSSKCTKVKKQLLSAMDR